MEYTENDLTRMYFCPRCNHYTSDLISMGRWECFYHPGEYDPDNGFTCCGKKERTLRYHQIPVLLGQQEFSVRPPKGCTPCDCGTNLEPIHIQTIAPFVDRIDIDKWKGFKYPTLYRSKDSHDNRSVYSGT
jgi:hypothetical protein